jgi:LysR family transcriptional regulator, regulator for metE and metH
MDLEIRHLRLVVAVAEQGSLTAAAEQLHLTQSALSHQLRDIEDRLRAPLFLRRNRRMTPTPAGQRLIEAGIAVLAQLERTESAVRDLGREKQGLLRVATECYTCYHWLPGVLREFGAKCPGVDVQIQLEATSRPLPVLLAGKLDLALMLSPVRDRRLSTTPLFRDELVVVVPARHRFAGQPYVHASQLADETMFNYSPREDSYVFTRLLTPAGISPRKLHQVQLTEAILELVRAGLGVSVLARWAVEPYLDRRSLAGVRLTANGFYRTWIAVVPRALAATPYVGEFLRLIASHAPVRRSDVTSRPVLRAVRPTG